jgi:hypothetical protein
MEDDKLGRELDALVHKTDTLFGKATSADISDKNKKLFGKCSSCKCFMFAESEYSIWYARCVAFEIGLSHKEPIVNCSAYSEIGTMTMWDMKQIATIIDIDKKTVGFIIQNR